MGFHRDAFYEVRRALQTGGAAALVENRRGARHRATAEPRLPGHRARHRYHRTGGLNRHRDRLDCTAPEELTVGELLNQNVNALAINSIERAAPEPATLVLAALGLTALGFTRRRRK